MDLSKLVEVRKQQQGLEKFLERQEREYYNEGLKTARRYCEKDYFKREASQSVYDLIKPLVNDPEQLFKMSSSNVNDELLNQLSLVIADQVKPEFKEPNREEFRIHGAELNDNLRTSLYRSYKAGLLKGVSKLARSQAQSIASQLMRLTQGRQINSTIAVKVPDEAIEAKLTEKLGVEFQGLPEGDQKALISLYKESFKAGQRTVEAENFQKPSIVYDKLEEVFFEVPMVQTRDTEYIASVADGDQEAIEVVLDGENFAYNAYASYYAELAPEIARKPGLDPEVQEWVSTLGSADGIMARVNKLAPGALQEIAKETFETFV